MGADQNFLRNQSVGLYPKNHHKPLNLGYERVAMDRLSPVKSPRKLRGSKRVNTMQIAELSSWTGLTGAMNRFDWLWKPEQDLTGLAVRSDRWHPEKPVNKTSREESQANEVQIQRNLEDTSATNLRTYPQEIFPKRSKKLENLREDQEGLGFSQKLENFNS